MHESQARIATYEASRYLVALAELWNHTYPVRYDNLTAEVKLPAAELVMTADGDSLTLRLIGSERDVFESTKLLIAKHVDGVMEAETGIRCEWHPLL